MQQLAFSVLVRNGDAYLKNFGRRVCGVRQPCEIVETTTQARRETLEEAKGDDRVPVTLLKKMATVWEATIAR
jgi:serine/threonine-protein kinase HipA